MNHSFDRAATAIATRLLRWLEQHVDVEKREWVGAMTAEFDEMDSGWQRLIWALSGLPLVWSFRPTKIAEPELVLSGSSLMTGPSLAVETRSSLRDYFAVLTALLLVVVVVGYIVMLLPVFQSIVSSFDKTLNVAGVDFARLGRRLAQAAGLVFLVGSVYVVRRPRIEWSTRTQTLLGGVNLLLGTSTVLLGVTLVQFIILLIPQLQQQRVLREREQAALYRLAAVGASSEAANVAKLGGPAEARFFALTNLSHEALRAGDAGSVAKQVAQELRTMLPQFEKNSEYANAVLYANLLAGHVALEQGLIRDARRYLVAAGNRPPAPPMTLGPNMRLAKGLLAYGDRKIVLEFLAQCRRFWPTGTDRLDAWTREINAGGKPDFGHDFK